MTGATIDVPPETIERGMRALAEGLRRRNPGAVIEEIHNEVSPGWASEADGKGAVLPDVER